MKISVIVSTYNQPDWLGKVLLGYRHQDTEAFELLVADDGSRSDTGDLIRAFREEAPFPVRHVWHEDRGYRRSVVLNRAVLAAEGDFLIFTDGDCIPRRDFISTHRRLAAPGRFLSGGAVYLPMETSEAIGPEDIRTGRFCDARWLSAHGARLGRRRLRLFPQGTLPTLLDRLTPTKPTFNLNNASAWKEHVVEANGFEAEMQYGGADRAFGERLLNLGVTGIQTRHRTVLIHLDHGRPYKTQRSINRNHEIRRRIKELGEVRALDGILQLPPDPAATVT